MILRIMALALSYVAGIVLASAAATPVATAELLALAGAGAVLSALILRGERKWREFPRILIALAAIICGLPLGYWRTMQRTGEPHSGTLRHQIAQLDQGAHVRFRGWICREADPRGESNVDIRVRAGEISVARGAWIKLTPGNFLCRVVTDGMATPEERAAMDDLVDARSYGYRVEGAAVYRPPRPRLHPGEFDFENFLLQDDVLARFRIPVKDFTIVARTHGHVLVEAALWAKRHFLATYKQTIRSPASRLVAAATLGTRRAVEGVDYKGLNLAATFRHAGVGHVLAVSGLHVSVISLLLYALFRMTGMRPRVFAPILITCLVLFALLTGARPSSVRAVIMNSVILIALAYFCYGIRDATYIGLALSALFILVINPMVLFAPSFILSFGAVTSLVTIAPTLDRWICMLRGAALLFSFAWFATLVALATCLFEYFLSLPNCLALLAVLWVLVMLGGLLNRRFPVLWKLGLERIPAPVRLMLSAQLAIQLGMMIPFSSLFFGQFPVAGVLVNLLAIPAIGILVQLGMLVGLIGLIPIAGPYLAAPFGAADSMVREFFFRLAYSGATWFPFPATPKPDMRWMVSYYAVLALILSIEKWRVPAQGLLYRLTARARGRMLCRAAVALVLAVLFLPALPRLLSRTQTCRTITCCAARSYPLVTLVSDRHEAITLNAGDRMNGERTVFPLLLTQGAAVIDTAILTSPRPEAGNEGLAALCAKIKVTRCAMPFTVADPAAYLDQIGDTYLLDGLQRNQIWARRYITAYQDLVDALSAHDTAVEKIGDAPIVAWNDLRISALPVTSPRNAKPSVFNQTPVISADVNGFRWLIVTETDPELLSMDRADKDTAYDVLVLPELSSRSTYKKLIEAAVACARPRVVIISGDRAPRSFDAAAWAAEHGAFSLFTTYNDGAVIASFEEDGRMQLRGYSSGRTVSLPRPATLRVHGD